MQGAAGVGTPWGRPSLSPKRTTSGCKSASSIISHERLTSGPNICSQLCLRHLLSGLQQAWRPKPRGSRTPSLPAVLQAARGQGPGWGLTYSRCPVRCSRAFAAGETADYVGKGTACSQTVWIQIQPLPFTGCGTSAKSDLTS